MDYYERFSYLRDTVRFAPERIPLEGGLVVHNLEFCSENCGILPGQGKHACPDHGLAFEEADHFADRLSDERALDVRDCRVAENRAFPYHVFLPPGTQRADRFLLILHGFNEKSWNKYLPWAHFLATATGRAVVLFPIAFHMNRAPLAWSHRRLMRDESERRKREYPALIASSLSNVAISTRLQAKPQRFIWSGLQTFYDVLQLLGEIRAGRHPLIRPEADMDIFAFSIGCLLSQVLLLTDPGGLFGQVRLGMFCGGVVFNRMTPVSRSILDSESNVALYSCLVEHLESHLEQDPRLRHYMSEEHPEGVHFRSLLNYARMRQEREQRFRELSGRLFAVALEQDGVMPPYEVVNTLQGAARDIPVPVEVLDFPYPYKHEDPFPALESLRRPVDEQFRRVFGRVAEFFS